MIPCVRFKDGVQMQPMTPCLARLICALDMTARMQGNDFTVSCGREGHAATDPHTHGQAIDVSVAGMVPEKVLSAYNYFRSILGDLFYVQYEVPATPVNGSLKNIAVVNPDATAPHFHAQSRRGTAYPPQDGHATSSGGLVA